MVTLEEVEEENENTEDFSSAKIVFVTGAAGYLASHIILLLLQNGYKVRATVKNIREKTKLNYLTELSNKYARQLSVYQLDIMKKEDSFQKIIKNCSYIVHCAAPSTFRASMESIDKCLDPIFQGTLEVLHMAMQESQRRSESIIPREKNVPLRFLFIGTVASSLNESGESAANNWNGDVDSTDCFLLGKTLAEKATWECYNSDLSQRINFQCTSLLFPLLLGPFLSRNLSSSFFLLNLLAGTAAVPRGSLNYPIIDVRDAASFCCNFLSPFLFFCFFSFPFLVPSFFPLSLFLPSPSLLCFSAFALIS